jgi:small subunit ribosomal protein S18
MARTNDRERNTKRSTRELRPRGKKRVCVFCKDNSDWVDYKDINLLRRFISDRGKIRSRRVTGNCTQHQREVQSAIKTARELALLPYMQRTVSERSLNRPRSTPDRPDDISQLEASQVDIEPEDYDLGDLDLLEHSPEAPA